MSHKNDSPNLTQKCSGLLKDWWSICLSYFFNRFDSMGGHKRLWWLFSANMLAMFFMLSFISFIVLVRRHFLTGSDLFECLSSADCANALYFLCSVVQIQI